MYHCTEMRFASFLSGGFTTMAVINPPERKLERRTSVHCTIIGIAQLKDLFTMFFAVQLPEDQRRNGRQDDDAPEATTDAGTTQPPNTITVIISRALQNIWGQWGQGVSYKNQFYLKFSLPLPLILL